MGLGSLTGATSLEGGAEPQRAERPPGSMGRAVRIWLLAFAGFVPLLWLDTFTLGLSGSLKDELWLRSILDPLRDYGLLFTQGVILAVAFALDPARRRSLWAAGLAVTVTNLLTQALKIAVARFRPDVGEGTFAFDVPWLRIFEDARRSFPSGHTSSAFALSVLLAHLYPRARWGFYLIAGGCAITRVLDARHFPTDIYAGAILGIVIGRWVIARWITQGESGEPVPGV